MKVKGRLILFGAGVIATSWILNRFTNIDEGILIGFCVLGFLISVYGMLFGGDVD